MTHLPHEPVLATPFKDRRTGLVVFGILSCVFAGILALLTLLTPLMLMVAMVAPRQAGTPPPDPRSMLVACGLYLCLAALFGWLGIDSIRKKRWVRGIAVTVGWTWLLVGVFAMAMFLYTAPDLVDLIDASATAGGGPSLPRETRIALVIISGAFSTMIYIVIPAAYIAFYGSRHVRATLEYFDPRPSWTERVPLQVLAMSVGLAMAALSMLLMLPYMVLPAFGVVLTGASALVAIVAAAGILLLCAWLVYRTSMLGWWLTLLVSIALPLAVGLTLWRVPLAEIYAKAGFPEETINLMRHYRAGGAASMVAMSLLAIACIGYMLYIRRYFTTRAAR